MRALRWPVARSTANASVSESGAAERGPSVASVATVRGVRRELFICHSVGVLARSPPPS